MSKTKRERGRGRGKKERERQRKRKYGDRAVSFAEFKESAFDKMEEKQDRLGEEASKPLFIGSLTETDVDHTGSPGVGPRQEDLSVGRMS